MASNRPQRLVITDEFGKKKTLASGPAFFTRFGPKNAGRLLLLGLGPEPAAPAAMPETEIREAASVSYVEREAWLDKAPDAWKQSIPQTWKRLPSKVAALAEAEFDAVLAYLPGLRHFPSFWGPLFAAAQLAILRRGPGIAAESGGPENAVVLPASDHDLLARELSQAFAAHGPDVLRPSPEDTAERLPDLLSRRRPRLFFSVNFKGLDPYGRVFHLLKAAGVPVVVWCVDNPLHLLSGLKAPFWRETHLFVTDDWFLPTLRRLGCERARRLPLAACPQFFETNTVPSGFDVSESLVFVGRSAFPGKKGFFSGCGVSEEDRREAADRIAAGGRPDFSWWLDKLGVSPSWPDTDIRRAGFGAEESGLALRTACLSHAAEAGNLAVFGDAGWRGRLPKRAVLHPEVDYYGPLASLYREARFSLNMTSLLLPRGLTQRHFDVFAAGGCLLTDATPGLDLFPSELTSPLVFTAPGEIGPAMSRLDKDRGLRRDLCAAWRDLLLREHQYVHRTAVVLDALEGWRDNA